MGILKKALALSTLAIAASGCGGNSIPEPVAVQKRAALESFKSCGELESYIEDTAVLDMRTQLALARDGYGGWWGWGGPMREMDAAAPTAGAGASANSGPSAYTKTNTQVGGVDEADFVKNDGTRIFVLQNNKLYATLSWPATQLAVQGKLEIEGWPRDMFLDEQNHVVVFSQVYRSYPLDSAQGDVCVSRDCGYYYSNSTKVTVVDATNIGQLKVAREYYLPGNYSNSRRIGSSVRLVLSDSFRWPKDMKWYPDYEQGLYEDKARLSRKYDELMDSNEKLIRQQSLNEWLPEGKLKNPDGSEVDIAYQCSDFSKSNAPTKLGLVTVATINLADPGPNLHRTSIVGESGEIFASHNNLYVANQHWWWWPAPGQEDYTYIHKFDITDPDKATYVASGGVDGHIVDQFSMDEDAAGFFRVATTISTRVSDPNNQWGRIETTNRVSVLGENSGQLDVVGKTPDIAPGERIYSSRFIEGRGYVVTYRQVDPFYTIDLSNPADPKVVGELKIPGFSTYIHPLDANHVLTIGTYIPENNTNWQARALQLAIFDVSDFANPKQTFTHTVGTAYSWSEAAYDHHAFNYFPEKKQLAIPFYDWNSSYSGDQYWTGFISELKVFGIDTQTGITAKGSLSMADMYQTYNYYNWTWYWTPWVRRSVMADNYVYAISDAGIRVADIANLGSPVATVQFDGYSYP